MKLINKKVATAVLALCAVVAHAQTKMTLGHNAAVGNPKHEASVKFAELVKAKSNGRFEIQVAPAAQLGDDVPILTSLRTGAVDLSANSQGAISSVVPEYAAFGMPFLFPTLQTAWKVLDGPVGQELGKHTEAKGMVVLGYWDNGIRHISNKSRPINTPADLKGMKLRTPPDPTTIDIMQALGADPQQIKFSELYVALQQGVVDGQENPLMNIWSSKLYEVQKYISYTSHKYEMTPFVMSKRSFDRLSEADRKLFHEAAAEATQFNRKASLESDQKLEGELKAKGIQFNRPDLTPFAKATDSVIDKWATGPQGEFVRKVVAAARAAK
ncbi:TRAP transporter substrate-binding protein [Limnohabitans sp. INBF002]|uniref:TRAP transporter substrate-binding protein n=1 Tax=Limnohabitans sp. INBF002 TaxID=2986280 RepID=UPI00237701B0|nr:TRAP transporter substrate-binding protein [Limnohabitans sp. INBF002]BDU51866.1 C4-dicarboxylate ABC transporter [Limnohabitans sp. INBF002]